MMRRDCDHKTVVALNWATACLVNLGVGLALWGLTYF